MCANGAVLGTAPSQWPSQAGLRPDSGLDRLEHVAAAVLGNGADVREAEVITGDGPLIGNDSIEEGAARGLGLGPVHIEHRVPAGIADEQVVQTGNIALDE